MLKTRRSGDFAAGLFLVLIGVVTLLASLQISAGAGGRLHPRTLPVALGALLLIGGGWLAILALRSPVNPAQTIPWPPRSGWRQWGIALGMMAAYLLLMQPLGFLVSTFTFVTGFILYFGKYKPWFALAWGLGTVVFIYVLFLWLLQLPFPSGILPF